MNFSSIETLNRIEEMANVLTSPRDIAIILEVEPNIFFDELRNTESEVYKAFYRGYLMRDEDIRTKNLDPLDVEVSEFTLAQLNTFKAKLIIQLHG